MFSTSQLAHSNAPVFSQQDFTSRYSLSLILSLALSVAVPRGDEVHRANAFLRETVPGGGEFN